MKAPAISAAVRAAFERLMAAYPARGDNPRTPALVVFARLVADGEDAEALVSASGCFADVMKAEKRDRRITRTWLSQRRFDDYLTDVPASADDAQPNPEHPLAFMVEEIGVAAWRSWIGSLSIGEEGGLPLVTARTRFQLDHLRKAGWIPMIEAELGAVCWRVAS